MMKKYQNNELYYAEYEQVKDQIRDMDILLFRRNCLISRVGRGFHYHAAKVVWWDDVLFSIEMRGRHGGRAIPLASQVRRYPGIIDVFRVNAYERWPEYKPEKGITFLKSLVGCHYGYFNFFKTAISHFPLLQLLNGFKKRNITVYDHENEKDGFPFSGTEYSCYCSEACAIADRISGVDPVPFLDNRYTEPADLARSSFYQYMFTIK